MSSLSPRQMFLLDEACRPLRHAFAMPPYLVGTAVQRGPYRDVDVRLILEDEQYDALADLFGPLLIAFLGMAIGEYLAARTGLPIDFQLQRQTQANERHPGPRNPMGVRTLVDYAGDGVPAAGPGSSHAREGTTVGLSATEPAEPGPDVAGEGSATSDAHQADPVEGLVRRDELEAAADERRQLSRRVGELMDDLGDMRRERDTARAERDQAYRLATAALGAEAPPDAGLGELVHRLIHRGAQAAGQVRALTAELADLHAVAADAQAERDTLRGRVAELEGPLTLELPEEAYERARAAYDRTALSRGIPPYVPGHYDAVLAAVDAAAPHLIAEGRRQAAEAIRATIVAGAPSAIWAQHGSKLKAAELAKWAARIAEGQVADG